MAGAPLLPHALALKEAPPPPPVLVRTFVEERDTEEVWHLVQGAYTGVEGHLPQSLEGWRATGMDKAGWDPELWLLLHDAKGIVGAALGEKGDTGQKRVGMITTLAVAHRARGQGNGLTLLLLLLDAFSASGCATPRRRSTAARLPRRGCSSRAG